jgi:hypothetical protein
MQLLRAIAATQAGRVSLAQVSQILTRAEIDWACRVGELRRVHAHVFAVAGFPDTPLASAWGAVREIGEPCAAAGLLLGAVLGWPGVLPPTRPELVVSETRQPEVPRSGIELRRLSHWTPADGVRGPLNIPLLDTIDGVMTLSRHVTEGELHTVIQHLVHRGELDMHGLWVRRRQGLAGSAQVTAVSERFLLGMDSPQEVLVYNVFSFYGRPPDHLNVSVVDGRGRRGGPYDGYSECGVGYQVDGEAAHGIDEQQRIDEATVTHARTLGLEVLRFTNEAIRPRTPMYEGWVRALDTPRPRPPLRVLHQPGRHCICGHRAW